MIQANDDETPNTARRFLMLQGPHGPFFAQLARKLERTGAIVHRVGFNAGDAFFWRKNSGYIAHTRPLTYWREDLGVILSEKSITDIVLYGDTRPVHAIAIDLAHARGLRVHVFEEGYLRPYWITYERDGSNGHSELCKMSVSDMRAKLPPAPPPEPAPDHWGALRHHIFYGALYHLFVMVANRAYRRIERHRTLSVVQEFRLYLRKLLLLPVLAIQRRRAERRIARGGFAYHLVLLQLAHDANFIAHSPFAGMEDFLRHVIANFAASAPKHHHLVFKGHPLDDGRARARATVLALARAHLVDDRVHYVGGGRLGKMLDNATSCITVNSTAAQQALWRALPLRAFGKSVYSKPEFVSNQPLTRFFSQPAGPDRLAYLDYRTFLLATSQVPGSYYSRNGRAQVLRRVVDAMLAETGPYALADQPKGREARAQHIAAVQP